MTARTAKDGRAQVEVGARRSRAVGTRGRIVAWLATHGDLEDPSGLASTALARSVSYSGSSVAFAQLLSGMERAGIIRREIRGKRTYRIALTAAGPGRSGDGRDRSRANAPDPAPTPRGRRTSEEGAADRRLDYDELARRLLEQVAFRLADEGAARSDGTSWAPGSEDDGLTRLERRVVALERELTHARASRLALQEENGELRMQLERVRSSLGFPVERGPGHSVVPERADRLDVARLQSLLAARVGEREPGTEKADIA